MRHAVPFAIALCVALAVPLDLGAQARPAPSHSAKIVPKFGNVTPSLNAAQLAALLAGPGVTISNAHLTGDTAAAGTFGDAQADLGIASGVVLSTGRVVDTQGPNLDPGTSQDFSLPGDADLNALTAPYFTQDAVVLEFDIVPAASTISVRYVFASEEYNEFVGSPFNDVIGIVVNGVNCSNQGGFPVSVNTINKGLNSELYVDNALRERDTEMNGLTVPLECVASVTPGVANRVKIAIADTADGSYDSALFLAAGGIRSPGSGPLTTSILAKVIEYYHKAFDHYFMTAIPNEIALLDNGTIAGWTRTGLAFNVFQLGSPGTVEVCRFFSTSFAPKSSHFYTPFAPECSSVKKNPNWSFEAAVFNMVLPNADASCPAGTQPLYRVYNDGMGAAPNHRYTTDAGVFDKMQEDGWKPEGAGVGIIACVPI